MLKKLEKIEKDQAQESLEINMGKKKKMKLLNIEKKKLLEKIRN